MSGDEGTLREVCVDINFVLPDKAAAERDVAIMNYYRNALGAAPVIAINPLALTALWNAAWFAGYQHHSEKEVTFVVDTPKPTREDLERGLKAMERWLINHVAGDVAMRSFDYASASKLSFSPEYLADLRAMRVALGRDNVMGTEAEDFCIQCGYAHCQCCPACSGYPECERDCPIVEQANQDSEKEILNKRED